MDKNCCRAPVPAPRAKALPAPASKDKGKCGKGGKDKDKGNTFFDGRCRRCGRWGHKEVTFRAVMSIESEELGRDFVNIMSKVLNVGPCGSNSRVLLLIDSGACLCVCPRDWCYVLATGLFLKSNAIRLQSLGCFPGFPEVKSQDGGSMERDKN